MDTLLSLPTDIFKLIIGYLKFKHVIPSIGQIKELDKLESVRRYKDWNSANIDIDACCLLSTYYGDYRLCEYYMKSVGCYKISNQYKINVKRCVSIERRQILNMMEGVFIGLPPPSTLRIRKFNLKTIEPNPKILIVGTTGMGSTTTVKDILHSMRDKYNYGLCMASPSDPYKEIFSNVFDTYNSDIMSDIIKYQRRKRISMYNAPPYMIVCDGVTDYNMGRDPNIQFVMKNGRCYNFSLIQTIQYANALPPDIRTCFDYIVLSGTHNGRELRMIYECYATIFPTFNIFRDTFNELTKDYSCMVINNRVQSSKIEDVVMWYKAKVRRRPFKFFKE